MLSCTFCESENIRPSGSSTLDAPAARLRRALTFKRLYRCRTCNALFEATLAGRSAYKCDPDAVRRQTGLAGISNSAVDSGKWSEEIDNPIFCVTAESPGRPETKAEVPFPFARTMEGRFVDSIISPSIRESIAVKEMALGNHEYLEQLCHAALAISDALRTGHKIFFFGNGGSAAVAQHLASEFMSRNLRERPDFPTIALTASPSNLTSMSDDDSFDLVFARQLRALGRRGDVAIGLTATGNSANVLRAVETARLDGLITVAMTGESGGRVRTAADFCLCIPSTLVPRIHEAHILTGHVLCEIVESELSEGEKFLTSQTDLSRSRRKISY